MGYYNFIKGFLGKVRQLAQHPHAVKCLALLGFFEAFIVPIPVDVMLLPMAIARPFRRVWYLPFLAAACSAMGGLVGYSFGDWVFEPVVQPLLEQLGYMHKYMQVIKYFQQYGFWFVLLAAFTPIPYKLLTIGAGMLEYNIFLFFLSSILGRTVRFFLVIASVYLGKKWWKK
jgi:membrane protein YqaA with SNARE-associated domain